MARTAATRHVTQLHARRARRCRDRLVQFRADGRRNRRVTAC